MTMRGIFALLIAGAMSTGAYAGESWGLDNEELATFDGKVTDVQCALTGDCPKNCGAGKRQLGFVTGDGKLILAVKNADPFAGTSHDLIAFCGKTVTADGLFVTTQGLRAFALQRFKPKGGEWIAANGFVRDWAAAHKLKSDSPELDEWYRHDEKIKTLIDKDGKLGLGPSQ
jgi:hypothetical protein